MAAVAMTVTACGAGGAGATPSLAAGSANTTLGPMTAARVPDELPAAQSTTQTLHASSLGRSGVTAPPTQSLCVGGTEYQTTQDDEFSSDSRLRMTSNQIGATPAPDGSIWSTQAFGFANGGTRNNIGVDDAYYTDASRGFGGYSPFSLKNGALNITAEPVPAQYSSVAALAGAHWLSGVLEGPAQTYGYVEVSAKEPNVQGFWPAPLWLLGMRGNDGKGNGYEEFDVNEIFGNALGPSVVQQTQIFSPAGTPPANYSRTTVTPDPSTSYHTYGVLWTPATVQYYVDRKPTSPAYPNAANGPANSIIILQVFAKNTWAPAPAQQTPQTMSLQYFRWYQSKNVSCSPTVLVNGAPSPSPAPSPTPSATATPTPTPTSMPTSSPSTAAPRISQDTGVKAYATPAPLIATFAQTPQTGDTLVAFVNAANPVPTPAGWTRRDAPGTTGFFIYSGVVGVNGLAPAVAYAFGTGSGLLEIVDISDASTTQPVLTGADPIAWQAQFPRSLRIPTAHGLLLSAWGAYTYAANGLTSIAEQLPAGQSERALSYSLDTVVSAGGAYSLRVAQITSEPFAASQPFTAIGTIAVSSNWNFNGDLVWIAPR